MEFPCAIVFVMIFFLRPPRIDPPQRPTNLEKNNKIGKLGRFGKKIIFL